MAHKKLQATATLFLDTSNAQSDAKKFVNDIKQKLAEVETAADKMSVFKDVVGYIAQIDRALTALKAKNADAFNSTFGGLDVDLKKQLEGIFGIDGAKLGQLDALREKLNNITPKSSIDDIRNFAKTMNDVFESIGLDIPFPDVKGAFAEFSKEAKAGHIETLKTKLTEFATVWEDVTTKMSGGFGVGGSGTGGFGSGGSKFSKEVQDEIDKLEDQANKYNAIIDKFKQVSEMKLAWENGDKIKIDVEETEVAAQRLIERFNELDDAINNGDLEPMEYADALAERAKAALQLIELKERLTKWNKNGDLIREAPKFLNNFLDSNDDGESITEYAIEDFGYEASDTIKKLQQEVRNTADQIAELKKSAGNAFGSVGSTASASGAFENIGNAAEDAGDKVDAFSKKMDNLSESIKKVYMSALDLEVDTRNGNASGKEFMNLFGADGIVSTTQGVDYRVDTDTLVQQLVANLNRDIVMSLHNHANGDMSFSPSDISSFAKMYYGQGTKINGIIANGFIHTIDFNGIGQEVAIQIAQDYQEGIQHLFEAKNIAQFASLQDGSIVPSDLLKQVQVSNPEYYREIIDQLQEATMITLRQAFEKNGAEFTLQSFSLDNIDELSAYLMNVQKNTQSAIEPVEKLKNLISTLRPNVDLSEFTEVFDKFKNGAIDGSQALKQILDLTPVVSNVNESVSSVDKAKAKVEEFLTLADKLQHENLYGSAENNVDIGRYIERLETAKTELEELGAQGLITAEDLEKVNQAFAQSKDHLEGEISHYDSYYSGPSYDYYDEYKEQQERAETAEGENTRLQRQLETMRKLSDIDKQIGLIPDNNIDELDGLIEDRKSILDMAESTNSLSEQDLQTQRAITQEFKTRSKYIHDSYDAAEKTLQDNLRDLSFENINDLSIDDIDGYIGRLNDAYSKLQEAYNNNLQGDADTFFANIEGPYIKAISSLEAARERLGVGYRNNDLDDELGDIQKENGALEDKLEILKDIADQYGVQITQKDRNSYDKLVTKEMEDGLSSRDEDRLSELGDKINEADAALEEFGNTYDKIILKLANGKKVEILPNDAGLRALNKFSDEGYGETYNGIDIEDVIFERKQEQSIIQESNQALKEQIGLEKQISDGKENAVEKATEKVNAFYKLASEISSGTMSASFDDVEIGKYTARLEDARAELEQFNKDQLITAETMEEVNRVFNVAQTELSEAKLVNRLNVLEGYTSEENLRASEKEVDALYDELRDEKARADELAEDLAIAEDRARTAESKMHEAEERANQYRNVSDANVKFESESVQLEALHQKLLEVKAAVDAKTQAFEEEYVTVDGVVDAEIASLQSLIGQLQEVVAQINLVGDAFNNINTNIPKIEIGDKQVEQNSISTENTHYVTDPQGRPVTMYRGIRNSYSGLVSNRYHGGTFSTDNIELAREYAGELGKVEKVLLSMKNPMEIDGHGAFWNQIEYIGDNSDEASQKLYELNAAIRATEQLLKDAEKIPVSDKESKNILRGLMTEDDTKRAREISYWTKDLEKYKAEKMAILSDDSNPYGKKNTNELVEIAKAKGYDGVIFKNIIDSATGDVKDLSTVMVTFEQDQIHYLETISSTFESSVAALKNHFGDLTQHISASSEEVESSIRKMVELRGKLNAGEISEDEYSAFISGNAIARDYEKLAKESMAVPDFITGALDGDEFDLKHVIQSINDMLDNMRNRMQNIAKAFGKEGMSFDQLLADNTNVTPVTESVVDDANIAGEVEQLDKLQAVLAAVKNAVMSKTKAFIDEGNTVGQVVGKEISALKNLSDIVDNITPKISTLIQNLGNIDAAKLGAITPDVNTNSNTGAQDAPPTDPFKAKLSAQTGAFTKYRNDIKDADYLTEDLEKQIDSLGVSLREVTDQSGLNEWVKRFNNLRENVHAARSEFEQMNLGTVNLFQKELTNSFNKLTLPQKEDMLKEYLQAIILLNQQKQAVQEGHAVELEGIKKITAALQEKINAQIEANKAAKDAANAQKKNGNFGSTASINATAKYNSLSEIANSKEFANSSTAIAILDQYEKAYKRMIATRDELRNKEDIDDSDKEEFKKLTTDCNTYASALEKLIKNTRKLKQEKANPRDWMLGADFVDNKEGRITALTDFVQDVYGVKLAAEDFKNGWNEAVFAVDQGNGTFVQMTAKFTDARNEIVALAGDTKKASGALAGFWDDLKGKFKSISTYLIASVSFYEVWAVIKQGVNHVREIDSALTELKKVTDETDASYAQFLQDMSKTGAVIGATVKDLTTMAAEWARLGYSMEEAGKLAESTAILLNVSEFEDATTASEALISTMQAFQYTADESGHVVDILNEVKVTCLLVQ